MQQATERHFDQAENEKSNQWYDNSDRRTRFPRARYIHLLTCTGISLRKRFFYMMSGLILCIFRIRCQIFGFLYYFFF